MDYNENQTKLHDIFSVARPVRSFEEVAEQIQLAITNGQINSGDRLPNERDLASIFQVSRATLREAIRLLEGAGIVQVSRGINGGTFVTEPKSIYVAKALNTLIRFRGASVEDLAEFRSSFEGEAAFWAAKRRTEDEISEMLNIVEQYKKALIKDPWSKLVELDVSFHNLVAIASKNSIREAIMSGIYEVLNESSLTLSSLANHDFRYKQFEELSAIANAINTRDSEKARELMVIHVERNAKLEVKEQKRLI